jgi:uracil-DNA glycosylase family 4
MGQGPEKAKIFIIGEGPGQKEAIAGIPFYGPSGQLLNKVLEISGTRRGDVYVTNAVLCAPMPAGVKASKPQPAAIAACSARLRAEIEEVDPEVIIAVGATSSTALGLKFRNITEAQGGLMWVDSILGGKGRWVMMSFHPAYILRNPTAFTSFRNAVQRAVEAALTGIWPAKEIIYDWEHLSKEDEGAPERAARLLAEIARGDWGDEIAIDVETGDTRQRSQLLQVAIANQDRAVVIDAEVFQGGDEEEALVEALQNPTITWLMHNSSFDLQHLYRNFYVHHSEIPRLMDTICLALGLDEQGGQVGLKPLARKFFNAPFYEEKIQQYLKSKKTSYAGVPRRVLAEYAAADVIYTARLYPILTELTHRAGTYDMCVGLLMPAQKAFADMEYDGVALDLDKVKELRAEWGPRIQEMTREIQEWIQAHGWDQPWPINPNSSAQMEHFLYDIGKCTPPQTQEVNSKGLKKRKTGKEWRELYADDPVWGELAAMLSAYKLAGKLMSTYVNGIADDIDRETGRVHCSFKPWGTVTGRVSIENPPLGTIPRKTTSGTQFDNVRNLFIAAPMKRERFGPQPLDIDWPEDEKQMVFLTADYKQLELRIAWFLSGDPQMGEDILAGDFHTRTASRIFEVPLEDVDDEQRHNTKYVTFGVMYGREEYSLAMGQLKKKGRSHAANLREASFYLKRWAETYHVFWDWRRDMWIEGEKRGIIRTPFGRVRRFPLRFAPDSKEYRDLRNQAYNFPVQSTAADVTLVAMISLNEEIRRRRLGRVLFTVYDSIEVEARRGAVDEVAYLMREHMLRLPPQLEEWPHPENFKLAIDLEVGRSWGEARTWTPKENGLLLAAAD